MDKLSVEDKAAYVNNTGTILSSVRVPIEAISCEDVNCENESHRDELGICFYKELVGAMSAASDQLKHTRSSFSTAALNCHRIILLIRNYELIIRIYELLIRNYELLIRNYELVIRNYELRTPPHCEVQGVHIGEVVGLNGPSLDSYGFSRQVQ